MDFSKLSRWEVVGAVASLVLVLSLIFLPWYDLGDNPERVAGNGFICGIGEFSCTGWETFPILRWLLLLAAAAPLILAYIVVRGHKLSWAPGEMTMVVGFTAFVLILYNGVIDPPGQRLEEIGITKQIGYYVALLASLGIATAGIMTSDRGAEGQPAQDPRDRLAICETRTSFTPPVGCGCRGSYRLPVWE